MNKNQGVKIKLEWAEAENKKGEKNGDNPESTKIILRFYPAKKQRSGL